MDNDARGQDCGDDTIISLAVGRLAARQALMRKGLAVFVAQFAAFMAIVILGDHVAVRIFGLLVTIGCCAAFVVGTFRAIRVQGEIDVSVQELKSRGLPDAVLGNARLEPLDGSGHSAKMQRSNLAVLLSTVLGLIWVAFTLRSDDAPHGLMAAVGIALAGALVVSVVWAFALIVEGARIRNGLSRQSQDDRQH